MKAFGLNNGKPVFAESMGQGGADRTFIFDEQYSFPLKWIIPAKKYRFSHEKPGRRVSKTLFGDER